MSKAGVFSILFVAALLAVAIIAEAQQPKKIPRIGYVSGTGNATDQGPYVEALRQGLQNLGYVDGKNIVIEFRGAEGKLDRIPSFINELVKLKVDVLVVPPIRSAIHDTREATKTIPIVMVSGRDPVEDGLVNSLARPGGNITAHFENTTSSVSSTAPIRGYYAINEWLRYSSV